MTKQLANVAAYAVQLAGVAAFIFGGFLVCAALGWVLLGSALVLVGIAIEREAT